MGVLPANQNCPGVPSRFLSLRIRDLTVGVSPEQGPLLPRFTIEFGNNERWWLDLRNAAECDWLIEELQAVRKRCFGEIDLGEATLRIRSRSSEETPK